jgi:UDP-glucose 4-epimerase
MKYLITGGAGFIGSHIVDRLISQGNNVIVYDNFSTGKELFIQHHKNNPKFHLIKGDVLDQDSLNKSLGGIDFVFHFAAHADVRSGFEDHDIDHVQNLEATQNVLEAMLKNNIKKIGFPSTSSVYGDAKTHPTPEDAPFYPTSLYGATKAACESYIYTYASYYDWKAYIFRFVSWIGERYTHGIVCDLMRKLRSNPDCLELLSDGTPRKSSLYVKDGVEAIFTILRKGKEQINVYNLGHTEVLTVDQMVNIILEESGVNPVKKYLGGKRGWKGDNDFVHLDTAKLRKLGWEPKTSIGAGMRKTITYLKERPELLR